MDDGATSIEESIEMARTLMAAGFTEICCTPHMIKGVYEYSVSEIKSRTEQLQQQLTANSIELKLIAGAEYYLDEYLLKLLDDPLPLGNTKQLLIEIPGHARIEYVKETCSRIKCSGFTPLIAHPERCSLLESKPNELAKKSLWESIFTAKRRTQDPALLDYLRKIGCKFQGNLGSFTGNYGNSVRNKAVSFLQSGLYDCFGSDAHTLLHLEGLLQVGMQTVQRIQAETPAEGQTG